jgi:protein-S-isoprenylcysteine O-methyltransferase Ste14
MTLVTSTHLGAQILLQATAIGFVVSEVSIRLRSVGHRGGSRVDRGSIVAVVVGIAAGALMAAWCAARVTSASLPASSALYGWSIALMWAGIALRQWAVWVLGRFFTVVVRVTAGQTVVDGGPYRWVRHPSYTGLLLTLSGAGVAFGNWLSILALMILPALGLAIRIRVEERALLAALGEPYRAYAAHHPRLIHGHLVAGSRGSLSGSVRPLLPRFVRSCRCAGASGIRRRGRGLSYGWTIHPRPPGMETSLSETPARPDRGGKPTSRIGQHDEQRADGSRDEGCRSGAAGRG